MAMGNATLGERTSISLTVLENDFPYGRIQFLSDPTMVFTGNVPSWIDIYILDLYKRKIL